ncbi:hypothetical protein PoB_001196600 [Plakobranchus ocellatus]|uniref:Uncharacterized protein n=1 Tax=Plakobranchus ocellatus TaxID=259542 RepID=A0AAV3YDS7_9GAST|nr:hypothetical protein PoB_001196600 [Plakobranchus ocellatus]
MKKPWAFIFESQLRSFWQWKISIFRRRSEILALFSPSSKGSRNCQIHESVCYRKKRIGVWSAISLIGLRIGCESVLILSLTLRSSANQKGLGDTGVSKSNLRSAGSPLSQVQVRHLGPSLAEGLKALYQLVVDWLYTNNPPANQKLPETCLRAYHSFKVAT